MSEPPIGHFLELLARGLRRPLAPARAAAEELRMTAADPNSQRIGELILGKMGEMERMVDTLLDISLLERGNLQATYAPLELQRVVESAVEHCRPALEAKAQRLILQLPDPWPSIEGDEPRLVQIVRNLLDNAVKFTPDGGSIYLSIIADRASVDIEVKDTGCGMTPTLLPKLFAPFVAGVSLPEAEGGGLGLGLTITKYLVELHNGTISATSEGPGEGSQFRVSLPLGSP
jgi:signal transduction histidine kinase